MDNQELHQLSEMVHAEAKSLRRRVVVLTQMTARLKEAVANDSPEEDTRNARSSSEDQD